jgi:hypothetical protein
MSFVSGREFTHAAACPPIFRKTKYAAKLRVLYQGLASAKPHHARQAFEKSSARQSCAQPCPSAVGYDYVPTPEVTR